MYIVFSTENDGEPIAHCSSLDDAEFFVRGLGADSWSCWIRFC